MKIPTVTEGELQSSGIKELTVIYNEFAEILNSEDHPQIKKFRDRPTGIKRILNILGKIKPVAKKAVAKPAAKKAVAKQDDRRSTTRKSKYDDDTVFELGANEPKVGTAMRIFWDYVDRNLEATAGDIISHFMSTFKQKRGLSTVDIPFTKAYISGALRQRVILITDEL